MGKKPKWKSIKSHILYDLSPNMLVQSPCYGTMLHKQVLFHSRRSYLHMKCLIFDEDVARVSADAFAHHLTPRLHEAILIVGCFDAIQTHELLNDFAYMFGVPFPHDGWVLVVDMWAL